VLDGDRTGQDPCVMTVGQREIAADQQVAIDDVAEQAAGCDRLPGECFAVAMEGDRVEAVGEPRVAADRTVEVGMADPVQPDGGVVQGPRATPDDVIALQCQHVGALEVDAGTSRRPDRAGVLDRIVLDIDRLAGETNRADRLADAALERILVRRVGLARSEEHTSELQSHLNLVCRLLLEKKKKHYTQTYQLLQPRKYT